MQRTVNQDYDFYGCFKKMNKELAAQECDARDDAAMFDAGYQNQQ